MELGSRGRRSVAGLQPCRQAGSRLQTTEYRRSVRSVAPSSPHLLFDPIRFLSFCIQNPLSDCCFSCRIAILLMLHGFPAPSFTDLTNSVCVSATCSMERPATRRPATMPEAFPASRPRVRDQRPPRRRPPRTRALAILWNTGRRPRTWAPERWAHMTEAGALAASRRTGGSFRNRPALAIPPEPVAFLA